MGNTVHRWRRDVDKIVCIACKLEKRKHYWPGSTIARYSYHTQDGQTIPDSFGPPDCKTSVTLVK